MDWEHVEAEFGWCLPTDYRDFVACYGVGAISDSLGISTPPFPGYPFVDHLLYNTPYPDPDNLLRWGFNEGGDDFYWRCNSDDPDGWTVAGRLRNHGWQDYPVSMVDFIIQLITQEIDPPLAARLSIDPPWFECDV